MEESVEGERVSERVKVLRLPSGDEAISATLTPATEDGKRGTQVRVEIMRRSFKKRRAQAILVQCGHEPGFLPDGSAEH